MTEKAKMIIHSVGVFLTGAVFSLALMGIVGCHVQNAYSEEASSLRQKRQAKGTTENGGYDKYTFELEAGFSTLSNDSYRKEIYEFDFETCTPTKIFSEDISFPNGVAENVKSLVNDEFNALVSNSETIKILALTGKSTYFGGTDNYAWFYCSFKQGSAPLNNSTNLQWYNFIDVTSYQFPIGVWLTRGGYAWSYPKKYNNPLILTYEKNEILLNAGGNLNQNSLRKFQDVKSYYLEQGYSAGETAGLADGYQEGYADGTEGTMLFTDIGANQTRWYRADLSATDSTDTTTTYKLLTYRDGNNQAHSIFAIEYLSDDSFLVVDYAGTSASSQYAHTTLGKGTMTFSQSGAYVDVVPVNYIHYDFAQITGVFNNSIPLNYFMISGLPENATGYQQGYNKGYQDALSSSAGGVALDNVFGLFSKAFGSVASFFNLKVFGFLPLYWFFLVPIFIAVITLLLRMVKH